MIGFPAMDLAGTFRLPDPRASLAVSVGAGQTALCAMPAARVRHPKRGMGDRSTPEGFLSEVRSAAPTGKSWRPTIPTDARPPKHVQ